MPNNIKILREKQGISQAELARRLRISRSYMNIIEKGKQAPNLKISLRMAEILKCSLDDIFLP